MILSNKYDIESRIEELESAKSNSDDPYENYSWEDSLIDALDGEMDAYWNID